MTTPINTAATVVTSGLVKFVGFSSTQLIQTNYIPDTAFILIDDGDATKKVQFQVSGITTATTRTMTWPDASGTVVLDTATQTLTNKTLTAPALTNATGSLSNVTGSLSAITVNDGYTEEINTANTSTAYTIDLANGSIQILTLTGNCTYTFPTAAAGKSFLLIQKQDGTGSRTVTWPATVKWPNSATPTITATASKADIFSFTSDGTNFYGRVIGQVYL